MKKFKVVNGYRVWKGESLYPFNIEDGDTVYLRGKFTPTLVTNDEGELLVGLTVINEKRVIGSIPIKYLKRVR